MEKRKNNRKNFIKSFLLLPLSVRVACAAGALLLVTMALGGVMAAYTTRDAVGQRARVAIMATDVTVSAEEGVVLSDIPTFPGDSKDFTVVVTNKRNGRICEVAQDYTLTVETLEEENLNLSWKVYSDPGFTTECTTLGGTLPPAVEENHSYYIRVVWPEVYNNPDLSFEVQALKVSVTAQQID